MPKTDPDELATAYAAVSLADYNRLGPRAPSVQPLVEGLWQYALPVLISMMADLRVLDELPRPLELRDNEIEALVAAEQTGTREELAVEILVATYPKFLEREFRDVPTEGPRAVNRWDPNRAGLGTWFVGACFQRAFDVLRQWSRDRRRHLQQLDREWLASRPTQDMFEGDVLAEEMVRNLITRAPHTVRPILSAVARGESIESAAKALGISGAVARDRLFQFRRTKVRSLMRAGLIDLDLVPRGHKLREAVAAEREFDWESITNNVYRVEDVDPDVV